jgi:phosphoglycerate dehydrogenase-like enzyme
VVGRLKGFGSTLLGHDPFVSADQFTALGVMEVELNVLAQRSDVITLHMPGGKALVDAPFLEQVKPTAILVNTARGTLIDEEALAAALRAGRLHRYAADVLGSQAGSLDNPLLADDLLDRTLFTPHAGAQTVEAVDWMGRSAVDAVLLSGLRSRRTWCPWWNPSAHALERSDNPRVRPVAASPRSHSIRRRDVSGRKVMASRACVAITVRAQEYGATLRGRW